MRKDVEFFKINGTPRLWKTAYPHRNLTQTEMALQEQLDQINWSCFVPSCENKRLMTNDNVVFFPVPVGKFSFISLNTFDSTTDCCHIGVQGQLWRSAVSKDEFRSYVSSIDNELELCCEEHFDVSRCCRHLHVQI